MTGRSDNRHAIVSGTRTPHGVGNGSTAAIRRSRDGALVSLVDRDVAAAKARAELLRCGGLGGTPIEADVTSDDDIGRAGGRVFVKAVMPGLADRRMACAQTVTLYNGQAETLRDRNASVPIGRMASPGGLAAAAAFSASDPAGQITGHCLPAHGGLALRVGLGGSRKRRSASQ